MKLMTKAMDLVTADELADLRRGRRRVELLRDELAGFERVQEAREAEVIARIENGADVDGEAKIVFRRRQNISWLTIVTRELGREAVVRTKDEWPVTFYKELRLEPSRGRGNDA